MADEGYGRDFPGNPNPNPQAPAAPARVNSASPASAPEGDKGGVAGTQSQSQQPQTDAASPKALFRVVRNNEGGHDIYKLSDDLETQYWGTAVNRDDVDAVLNASATYDPTTQSWDVPETVARSIADGRLSFPQEIAQSVTNGEAGVVRAYNALKFINGEASRDDVVAKNHQELLKTQLGPGGRPDFAWAGLGKQVAEALTHPVDALLGAAKFAVGSAAGFIPMGVEVAKGSAKGAAAAGGPALIAGAATGTLELPPVAAGVGWLFSAGALAGASKTLIDLETGTLAADMLDAGFPDQTVKDYAQIGGAIKGVLWMTGFKYLPAPGKEKLLGALAGSETVQKVAANWLVKYGGEVAGGTALGVAQEKVRQVLNNMAAVAANKPELLIGDEKGHDMLLNAALSMGAGVAVIGLPGAVLGGLEARARGKAEIKAAEETKVRLAERDKALAAEPPKPLEVVPPAEAVKTVDAKGDYLPPETPPAEKALHEALDKNAPAADVVLSADKVIEELGGKPTEAKAGPPATYEQKLHEAEAKAATRSLESDLATVRESIAAQQQTRGRFERLGRSTVALDKKINDLLDREQEIKNGITFYEAAKGQAIVTPNEKLSMKPATLESIAALGFVEGRKEVLDVRRQKILAVGDKLDLTQADMRSLLKDKNYGTMSDAQFENWLNKGSEVEGEHKPSFTERAAELKTRKVALGGLRAVQKDRAIVHEQYVRQLHELPVIGKMTTKQIGDYAEILQKYDKGDEALTPARVKALETTELKGAKTKGEVRDRFTQLMNAPVDAFKTVKIQERDMFTPDPQLARKDPWRGYVVSRVKELQVRAERVAAETLDHLHELAAAAIKERRATLPLGARIMDWLVPQQKELLTYIEADKGQAYAGQITLPDLTPSEKAYADAWLAFSDKALGYLKQVEGLESRFDGKYIPHVHRSLLEMAKDIPETGWRSAVKELWNRLETPAGAPTDEIAKALGMRKAFDYTEFRTGNLKPSTNVFAVVDHYVKLFHNKVALDEAVPLINTVIKAFAAAAENPEAEQLFKTITAFTDQYLVAKKGDARWIWAKGGHVESAIRLGTSLVALKHIALNVALQAMSPIGEATGEFMALGNRGIARARARRFTDNGQALLAKYHAWVGEGPVEQIHPGSDVGDVALGVMYGAFKAMRKSVMKDILLGSVTPEELKTGVVSDARLAQIKLDAGRWIDVHGNKSIRGASVMGAQWTQFKSWVIPPTLSIAEDAMALKDRIVSGKKLTPEHVRDFVHLGQLAVAAVLFRSFAQKEMEDDSFIGRAIHYARGEVLSMFSGPKSLVAMIAGGVLATETAKLANNLVLLGTLEGYKTDTATHAQGDLKGWDALMKQFTPAAVKQFQSKDGGKP